MSKPLYVLVSDGGDGSYHPQYILDSNIVFKLQRAYDKGIMDYENGIGVDGDGFHYSVIQVPDDATAESLGISICVEEDFGVLSQLED